MGVVVADARKAPSHTVDRESIERHVDSPVATLRRHDRAVATRSRAARHGGRPGVRRRVGRRAGAAGPLCRVRHDDRRRLVGADDLRPRGRDRGRAGDDPPPPSPATSGSSLAGTAIFAVASVVAGASTTLPMLLVARGAQGVGATLLLAGSLPVLAAVISSEERARKWWVLAATVGAVVGPALGGVLTQLLDWRAIFYVQAPVVAAALLVSARPGSQGGAHGRAPPRRTRCRAPPAGLRQRRVRSGVRRPRGCAVPRRPAGHRGVALHADPGRPARHRAAAGHPRRQRRDGDPGHASPRSRDPCSSPRASSGWDSCLEPGRSSPPLRWPCAAPGSTSSAPSSSRPPSPPTPQRSRPRERRSAPATPGWCSASSSSPRCWRQAWMPASSGRPSGRRARCWRSSSRSTRSCPSRGTCARPSRTPRRVRSPTSGRCSTSGGPNPTTPWDGPRTG